MLQVQNIEKYYGSQNQVTKALDRVLYRGGWGVHRHYGGLGQRKDHAAQLHLHH